MNKDLVFKKDDRVTFIDLETQERDCMSIFTDGETIAEFEANMAIVLKVERPTYETLYEIKELLNEKERKFLTGFVELYRDKIIKIKKIGIRNKDIEFVCLYIKNGPNIKLPIYKKGTMYKGMEIDKGYTLEELGL